MVFFLEKGKYSFINLFLKVIIISRSHYLQDKSEDEAWHWVVWPYLLLLPPGVSLLNEPEPF